DDDNDDDDENNKEEELAKNKEEDTETGKGGNEVSESEGESDEEETRQEEEGHQFSAPTAQNMEILIQTCLMPLAIKIQNDSFIFVHKLKQETNADLKGFIKTSHYIDFPQTARQVVRNTNVIKPGMYQIDTRTTQTRAPQLPQTSKNTNPRMSTSTRVIHKTNVCRPQLRSTQMKDKVAMNDSQVKFKKIEVEDDHRISSVSNKTKSVTACNDSLKSRTLNVNAICAICGKCVFDSDHYACVSKVLNDMNARTKKPHLVPISARKPKGQENKSFAIPPKKTVISESTIQKSKSYYQMLYEKTSKA
nr:hypothetical protein [Tanacetum cinerariifolium]